MRYWYDEETGAKMCEPDCVDEWLFNIWSLGFDYDGCHTAEEFKELVDELVDMSKRQENVFGILNCLVNMVRHIETIG